MIFLIFRHKKETFCESCYFDKIETLATHFCKTCETPDALCEFCAQQHIRQKATRGHEICNDMDQLYKLQQKPNQK